MSVFLEEVEGYVLNYLKNNLDKKFVYHSISHTLRVVEKTIELATLEKVVDEDLEILLIAAWFHDTGYSKDIKKHEKKSTEIASDFLSKKNKTNLISKVSETILATQITVEPKNLLEEILKDADSSHIGSKNYNEFSELLKKEFQLTKDIYYSNYEWIENNINFLSLEHQFYTNSGIKLWAKQKNKNLVQLFKEQEKQKQEISKTKQKKRELEFKKNKTKLPERGVDTMFRVALRNHITLSNIADTKANILLSVNAIIISMALSTLIPKLDNPSNSYLIIPSIIFIIFTVISIILSILATRPNVTKGKFTKEDVAQKKVNLIFFGNFHKMSLPEFEWAMDEMLKDRDYLYGALTKDLYFLGIVLNRKYNILRTTYVVFMIGIITSVIAFAIAFYSVGHVIK